VSKNRKIRWTPEEDQLLRKRVVANVPVSEIAAELGRSISSVKARAHVLRVALGRYILK
jgi:DNA-directed RNA polymerase specialized sigma24 family protein